LDVTEAMRDICRDEFFSYHIYSMLARSPLINKNARNILRKAADDEFGHYMFWKRYVGECASGVSIFKAVLFMAIFHLFGLTITLKYVESKEADAISVYKYLSEARPDIRDEIEKIREEEEKHEADFAAGIDEGRVKYIGSITLGISDALIELTGIYTGSLGAFRDTLSAGLTGVLAGIAASISMGVASYSQAKHEGRLNPRLSALYTFISYLSVVSLLALPYFLAGSLIVAFSTMVVTAVLVVAYISFYAAVLHGRSYLRELIETSLLIFGVSSLLYILGSIFGSLLGVKQLE